MRRKLSTEEIAAIGLADGKYAKYLESVHVIGEGTERSRHYMVRVNGVTNTFCAESFGVKVVKAPGDVLWMHWSVTLPNGFEWQLEAKQRDGRQLDQPALRFALGHTIDIALSWGALFRDVVPVEELAAIDSIMDTLEKVTLNLENLVVHAAILPDEVRVVLSKALSDVSRLPGRVAALQALAAQRKPGTPPR